MEWQEITDYLDLIDKNTPELLESADSPLGELIVHNALTLQKLHPLDDYIRDNCKDK